MRKGRRNLVFATLPSDKTGMNGTRLYIYIYVHYRDRVESS